MTAEEYKELNELRRYKARREIAEETLGDLAQRLANCTATVRELIALRKKSSLPDGGDQ